MEWFARPGAFARLAPPWMPARLVRESASLADGTAVLALPFGLLWAARHQPHGYLPGRRFEDRSAVVGLRSAPMGLFPWIHEHGFEPTPQGHTLMSDSLRTPIPPRLLRPMIRFRQRQVAWDLQRHADAEQAGARSMVIALAAEDGELSRALTAFLSTGGHRVIRLVHHAGTGHGARQWHPHAPTPGLLQGCDAVIAWGADAEASGLLVREAAHAGVSVAVLGEEHLPDAVWSPNPAASPPAPRVVHIRAGYVLGSGAAERGMLRRGTPARGAWIGLDDLVDVVHRCLWDAALRGTVLAAAPSSLPGAEMDPGLRSAGHRFRYPELSAALRHTLGRETQDQIPNAGG